MQNSWLSLIANKHQGNLKAASEKVRIWAVHRLGLPIKQRLQLLHQPDATEFVANN